VEGVNATPTGDIPRRSLSASNPVLYVGAIVVLVTKYARPNLRPELTPVTSSAYLPLVLIGYVVLVKGMVVRRARRAHGDPRR